MFRRSLATVLLVALALLNVRASARGTGLSPEARIAAFNAVPAWVGSYLFKYTEVDTGSHGQTFRRRTETDNGAATFTIVAPGSLEYKGSAQASYAFLNVFKYVLHNNSHCAVMKETKWARGTATAATQLLLTGQWYMWQVIGFLARQHRRATCVAGKVASRHGVDQWPLVMFVPLPSTLVLCGTLDVEKSSHGMSKHLVGTWAFYPEGQLPKGSVLSALPASCAHIGNSKMNQRRYLHM